jgi:uncharacterized protein (DUF2252 family)
MLLEETNRPRLPDLAPVRYGRMLSSPFAFLRGSAVIMAHDLAHTPRSMLPVQACGDAHLANFRVFGTPERNLVFDVNDFDETLTSPWERDIKRLATSVILAARNLRIGGPQATSFARAAARAYRRRMGELATAGPLDVWYDRIDVGTVLAIAQQDRAKDLKRQLRVSRVRQRTSLRVLPKLTRDVNGMRKIIDDPPLIGHLDPETFDGAALIEGYMQSLPPDRRPLLERYRVLDTVRKVVGIGSVGTRWYLSLLADADDRSPIFLQLKEELDPVLTPHVGKSEFGHRGQRVVVGQRLMQAASHLGDTGDLPWWHGRAHASRVGRLWSLRTAKPAPGVWPRDPALRELPDPAAMGHRRGGRRLRGDRLRQHDHGAGACLGAVVPSLPAGEPRPEAAGPYAGWPAQAGDGQRGASARPAAAAGDRVGADPDGAARAGDCRLPRWRAARAIAA